MHGHEEEEKNETTRKLIRRGEPLAQVSMEHEAEQLSRETKDHKVKGLE